MLIGVALPVARIRGFVRRDHRFVALTDCEQLVLRHDVLAARLHVVFVDSRFDDRVEWTRFLAKTAVDAPQGIDLVANRKLFNRVVRILARLDVNTISGTGSRAQKTSRALNQAVFFQGQAVPTPEGIGIRRYFVGVLDGNRRLNPTRQAKLVERVHEEITPEAVSGNRKATHHLGEV